MHVFCCPNCQHQAMQPLGATHYFHCTKCLREWFILEWVPEEEVIETPLLPEPMCSIFGPAVDAIVNDFLREKGVPS